jgi:hypothetical protein
VIVRLLNVCVSRLGGETVENPPVEVTPDFAH